VAFNTFDHRQKENSGATDMIPPAEAWQRIEEHLKTLPTESVPRAEAVGRVLAEPLLATVDVPGLDVSAMDGFAVAGELNSGQILPVTATIAAGDPPGARLEPGSVVSIMTGAPTPAGTDRVLPVEQTVLRGDSEIEILSGVPVDAHIRHQGEVLRRGTDLLSPPVPLTPAALSLLATHGYDSIVVHRRPQVAVLATGDEVIPPDVDPQPGQLRDSNTDFLLAAGRSLGLSFISLGIAPDHPDALRTRIEQGLESDVLLIGGGVSMGEFDFVEDILAELRCEVLVDAVATQPGKPLVVARHPNGFVFGLPGNPASVMVGFWLFVRPVLRRLQGIPDAFWSGSLRGELAGPLPGAKARDRFLSAEVRFQSNRVLVTPRLAKGSHDLAAFARGSALVRIAARAQPASPGDPCEILPFVDWQNW